MDTKPLETQAELRIHSELTKYGFIVNKPNCDTEGADLVILDSIKKKNVHLLRVQCKGRTIKNNGSYIDIPVSYLEEENFVVFLYVVDENLNDMLFIFFHNEIIKWDKSKDKYILRFTHKRLKDPYFLEREFNKEIACKLKNNLKQLILVQKIKKYTTLIIDGLFLESSIQKTIQSYKKIYPDRQFNCPSLQDVATSILSTYDYFESNNKIINCYICYYTEDEENIGLTKSKITTDNGIECTVYIEKQMN